MTYAIKFTRTALRQLRRIPTANAKRIVTRLEAVAEDPFAPNANIRPLRGAPNAYRLRIGTYRAVYELNQTDKTMIVASVFHRQEGY